jgi:uncharacterized protein YjbJ (UPF0337 family)
MNADQVKGNWKKVTGEIKKKWGKLTDDDIKMSEGRADILAGRLQERYGNKKEEANDMVNDFFKNIK